MHGLFECMSSGCVAQKGDHAKISCQVIQGLDRTLVGNLKVMKNSQCCKIMYELMFANLNYFKLHF